jgi:uncharacterized repeat protein (TIGR01451 family)
MKLLCKNPIVALLVIFVMLFGIGLVGPMTAQAVTTATTPDLGVAASYAILADTLANTSVTTTINGDIGYTTGPGVNPPGGVNTTYIPAAAAGAAQAAALTALNSAPNLVCDVTFAPGAIDLGIDHAPEHVGTIYTPGVYCITGAMSIDTSPITLSGAGTYIFRSTGAFTTSAGMTVTLAGGASACDVFWNPSGATTIGANNFFEGTVIPTVAGTGAITVNDSTLWHGRALTFGQPVTLPDLNVTIDVPTCTGNINVAKIVVGGSKVIADFPLFVNGGPVVSGATNPFAPGVYTITETGNANYAAAYSGDCIGGTINLLAGANNFCIVTNTYTAPLGGQNPQVPPLIDVVKVPNPLALPAGPGSVTYTYTVTNPGTEALNNVTLVGDTCSPIVLISGDLNSDSQLQSNETWVHTCTTTLTETHTNNVVASGSANGITATDIASATVVVGVPAVVPPLIHVTKLPSPLLLGVGGGMVTYTEKITNPGTVALSNVQLTDDKCSPMTYISGDTNTDSMLDTTETWTYTCSTNLTATTTNTASASGFANGITIRDFAIATVVVALPVPPVPPVPALPDTGFAPQGIMTLIVLLGMLILASVSLYIYRKKLTN